MIFVLLPPTTPRCHSRFQSIVVVLVVFHHDMAATRPEYLVVGGGSPCGCGGPPVSMPPGLKAPGGSMGCSHVSPHGCVISAGGAGYTFSHPNVNLLPPFLLVKLDPPPGLANCPATLGTDLLLPPPKRSHDCLSVSVVCGRPAGEG